MTLRVAIYVYEEVEVLDFAGPFEVFSTASRVFLRSCPGEPPPFEVVLVSEKKGTAIARGGFGVSPHHTVDGHPKLDVLLVPGGVHEGELRKPRVIEWIARRHAETRLTASVCTGAFLLAAAGVLDGLDATTHREDCDDLERSFPAVRVRRGARWIEHERVMTSAGISAGIDMALRIVSRLAGQPLAERTARQMEYDWRERAPGEPNG